VLCVAIKVLKNRLGEYLRLAASGKMGIGAAESDRQISALDKSSFAPATMNRDDH